MNRRGTTEADVTPASLTDDRGPIPSFGTAQIDESGQLRMTEDERRERAQAVIRTLDALRRLPDDDPPGIEAEVFRALDEGRPHRPLFEKYR